VRRILNITVNILLLVMMVVLMISVMPISRTIFAFMHIQNNGLIARQIHVPRKRYLAKCTCLLSGN